MKLFLFLLIQVLLMYYSIFQINVISIYNYVVSNQVTIVQTGLNAYWYGVGFGGTGMMYLFQIIYVNINTGII